MVRKKRHLAACCMTLSFFGCAAPGTEGGGSDFMSSVQQAIGSASVAIGLTSVTAGIGTKNSSLASSGGDLLRQGAQMLDTTNKPSNGSAGAAGGDNGQPARNGQSADLNAVARRCTTIAEAEYPAQAQNQLLQRGACTYYCAYNITGDQRYLDLFHQSQDNANSLCSAGINRQCNDVQPLARCNYR